MTAAKPSAPTELLFSILVTFLTPLFLGGPTGNTDLAAARAAAVETLNSFGIRTAWDLFTAVRIVGFGIAALGSLCLSLEDGMTTSAVLRCRSNANALQRTADRAQAALDKRQAQAPDVPEVDPVAETAVLDAFRQAAEAQHAVAAAKARAAGEEPPDSPGMIALREVLEQGAIRRGLMPAPTGAEPVRSGGSEWRNRMAFAGAMATVATEFAQDMRHLPPAEQRKHQMRIAALAEVSQTLSSGAPLDAEPLPGLSLPAARPRASAVTS